MTGNGVLKHALSAYGMTPADYRAKWDLPANYPTVAPVYAERRSALAKQIGLGRSATPRRRDAAEADEPDVQKVPAGKRGGYKARSAG